MSGRGERASEREEGSEGAPEMEEEEGGREEKKHRRGRGTGISKISFRS